MAFTDTKAVIDSQKTRDTVNTAEQVVMSRAHAAMMKDVNSSMLAGGNSALAELVGGKAAPIIEGESMVITPAPYPVADKQPMYSPAGIKAADDLINAA